MEAWMVAMNGAGSTTRTSPACFASPLLSKWQPVTISLFERQWFWHPVRLLVGQDDVGLELHSLHAFSGLENWVAVVNLRLVRANMSRMADERSPIRAQPVANRNERVANPIESTAFVLLN